MHSSIHEIAYSKSTFDEGGLSNVAENLQKAWLDKIP